MIISGIITLVALWYLAGIVPAILIWRTKFDVTASDMIFILPLGLFGPICACVFWVIVLPHDKIIIPKRRP